jgi:hypothetical protein
LLQIFPNELLWLEKSLSAHVKKKYPCQAMNQIMLRMPLPMLSGLLAFALNHQVKRRKFIEQY